MSERYPASPVGSGAIPGVASSVSRVLDLGSRALFRDWTNVRAVTEALDQRRGCPSGRLIMAPIGLLWVRTAGVGVLLAYAGSLGGAWCWSPLEPNTDSEVSASSATMVERIASGGTGRLIR